MGEAKRKRALGGPSRLRRVELQRLFEGLRIDYSQPGFYDDPSFMAEEQRRPLMLETYGEWVLLRERTSEYESHVRDVLTRLAPIISARLDRHEWFGSCTAVTAMLTRMLDRLGVWNTIMKGSASIYTGGHSRHFAIIDENEGQGYETGHHWLIAPPYDIVDLALYHQRWRRGDSEFQSRAPKIILAEKAEIVRAQAQDVIAPALLRDGTDAEMHGSLRDQRRFGSIFPARRVVVGGLDIRYVASGMSAPQEPLEGINTVARAGVPAIEIWREDVAPAFGLT
jgi:hypothetical protein